MTEASGSAAPTRLLDRLVWTRDEDGGWNHRLASEWDGNGGNVLFSRYAGEHHETTLTWGVSWSSWGLGPHVEFSHGRPWLYDQRRSVPTRHVFVTLALGPLYLSLHVSRVRKGFDPHA